MSTRSRQPYNGLMTNRQRDKLLCSPKKRSESFVHKLLNIKVCLDSLSTIIVFFGKRQYVEKAKTSTVLDPTQNNDNSNHTKADQELDQEKNHIQKINSSRNHSQHFEYKPKRVYERPHAPPLAPS